jgi:HEAT repeat protein
MEHLRSKLEDIRRAKRACFGSEKHRFELEPPLDEKTVLAFEKRRKLTLPEDFRRFLLTVGAAGAGPFYGLLPMKEWRVGVRGKKQGLVTLTLVDQGCNNWGLLVLEGSERGRVVYLSDLGALYYPDNPSFVSWYERWLDETLWGYDYVWFGTGMSGREADFLRATKSHDPAVRNVGTHALARLPDPSAEARAAMLGALHDTDARVRATAVAVLSERDKAAVEPRLPELLRDPDRHVVLAALRSLRGTPHRALAAPLVGSDDAEIVRFAIHFGEISERDLVRQLDGPAWESATTALRTRGDGSATPHLIAMIEDEDLQRRRAAVVCLRVRKEPSAASALLARFGRETDPEMRMHLVEAIGAAGDLESLLGFARHEDPRVRFRAAYALRDHHVPRSIAVLQSLTSDEVKPGGAAWTVAEQARRSLAVLGEPS